MVDLGHDVGLDVFGDGARTIEGGFAVRALNKTGAPSVKGSLVQQDSGVDSAVALTGLNCDECVGVMWSDGIADGEDVWVVTSGYAYVLLDVDSTATRGNWAGASEAGLVDGTGASPPAAPGHFQETGHIADSVGAPAGGESSLTKMWLHLL